MLSPRQRASVPPPVGPPETLDLVICPPPPETIRSMKSGYPAKLVCWVGRRGRPCPQDLAVVAGEGQPPVVTDVRTWPAPYPGRPRGRRDDPGRSARTSAYTPHRAGDLADQHIAERFDGRRPCGKDLRVRGVNVCLAGSAEACRLNPSLSPAVPPMCGSLRIPAARLIAPGHTGGGQLPGFGGRHGPRGEGKGPTRSPSY
jgi:hypothetical protein